MSTEPEERTATTQLLIEEFKHQCTLNTNTHHEIDFNQVTLGLTQYMRERPELINDITYELAKRIREEYTPFRGGNNRFRGNKQLRLEVAKQTVYDGDITINAAARKYDVSVEELKRSVGLESITEEAWNITNKIEEPTMEQNTINNLQLEKKRLLLAFDELSRKPTTPSTLNTMCNVTNRIYNIVDKMLKLAEQQQE